MNQIVLVFIAAVLWMAAFAEVVAQDAMGTVAVGAEVVVDEGGIRAEVPASGLGYLDALLGLEPAPDRGAEREAISEVELDRRLRGREAQQAFVQAVQQMEESATRLGNFQDTGIVTQRLQEEVIAKLDVLIRSAEEQQRQQSQSQQSQAGSQSQQQQAQQQTDQTQAQQQSTGDPRGNQQQGTPTAAELAGAIESASAAWGALPPRVREALLQGLSERFSELYAQQTEAYFRRLAEEVDE